MLWQKSFSKIENGWRRIDFFFLRTGEIAWETKEMIDILGLG